MANQIAIRGFTFIEVIIVIAVLGIIVGLGIPFYQSFQVSSQLDNTTQQLIQTLRRAQLKATASENFSDFGVHFELQSFTLFQGSTYSPIDSLNEVYDLTSVLSISSGPGPDVVFARVDGTTSNTGSVTITTSNGESSIITINGLGAINAL